MTGKKNPRNSTAAADKNIKSDISQNLDINTETIRAVIKSVINDTNIIQESMFESMSQAPPGKFMTVNEQVIKQLKEDYCFIDSISEKICEKVLNNETFKQTTCDSISFELKNKLELVEKEKKELKCELEELQQYSRRNCLLIHGMKPESRENTDVIAKDFFNSILGIPVSDGEIDRSYRIGNPNGPIIVKLVRHNLKSLIYSRKKMLKGQNMLITESLTKKRIN